jgi:hypothetical protein
MKEHVTKFLIGAFGTFLIVMFKDVSSLPMLKHFTYAVGTLVFIASGGFATVICQIGDKAPFRSFYFGCTWPALISILTLSR